MATITRFGTVVISTHNTSSGAAFVPGKLMADERVLLTASTTEGGQAPSGRGPLYCAAWRRTKRRNGQEGIEIVAYDVNGRPWDGNVRVDWAIVGP